MFVTGILSCYNALCCAVNSIRSDWSSNLIMTIVAREHEIHRGVCVLNDTVWAGTTEATARHVTPRAGVNPHIYCNFTIVNTLKSRL